MIDRDEIEAGADLTAAEIEAAKDALRAKAAAQGEHMTGCSSYLSRTLHCGFNQSSRMLSLLEAAQFITAADAKGERRLIRHSSGPRPTPKDEGDTGLDGVCQAPD